MEILFQLNENWSTVIPYETRKIAENILKHIMHLLSSKQIEEDSSIYDSSLIKLTKNILITNLLL